jgi:hypothetical protein
MAATGDGSLKRVPDGPTPLETAPEKVCDVLVDIFMVPVCENGVSVEEATKEGGETEAHWLP